MAIHIYVSLMLQEITFDISMVVRNAGRQDLEEVGIGKPS